MKDKNLETIRYSQIGAEDLAIGTGNFEADLADGRRVALSRINLATFSSTAVVPRGIYFADDNGNLTQQDLFVYNNLTAQMLITGGISAGLAGVTAAKGQLYAVNDGAATIGIENTSSTDGDTLVVYHKEGLATWNTGVDDSNSDNFSISTGATPSGTPHLMFISGSTAAVTGSNTANANSTNGFTINQGTSDNEVLSFKSSDIAHGVTTLTETDTYMLAEKADAGAGGALLQGFSETTVGFKVSGVGTTTDTTESTAAIGAVVISGSVKSGTTITALAATDNLAVFETNGTARLIVKGDGDVEADGTVTSGSFDEHDDIQLLEAFKTIGNPNHRNSLGEWVNGHLDILEAGGVIRRYEDGYFISTRGIHGLLVDAIRQLGARVYHLEQRAEMGA